MKKCWHRVLKRKGSISSLTLIVGICLLVLSPLFLFVSWVLIETSSLMELRTEIWAPVWAVLFIGACSDSFFKSSSRVRKVFPTFRNSLIAVYLGNGVLLLMEPRPALFWILLVWLLLHVAGVLLKPKVSTRAHRLSS